MMKRRKAVFDELSAKRQKLQELTIKMSDQEALEPAELIEIKILAAVTNALAWVLNEPHCNYREENDIITR